MKGEDGNKDNAGSISVDPNQSYSMSGANSKIAKQINAIKSTNPRDDHKG